MKSDELLHKLAIFSAFMVIIALTVILGLGIKQSYEYKEIQLEKERIELSKIKGE